MTSHADIVPFAIFGFFAVKLSWIDARHHILPNRLVFFSALAICAAELSLSVLSGSWNPLGKSLIVGVETVLAYSILIVVSRGQLGMGDLKYSFVTGLTIGWIAPNMWLMCIWCSFALACAWIVLSRMWTTRTSMSYIAFGPFMSTAVALCALTSHINF